MKRIAAMRAADGKCDGSIGWLCDRHGFARVAHEMDGKEGFRAEPASVLGSHSCCAALMSPVAAKATEPVQIS